MYRGWASLSSGHWLCWVVSFASSSLGSSSAQGKKLASFFQWLKSLVGEIPRTHLRRWMNYCSARGPF
jgi:hypothetical protein